VDQFLELAGSRFLFADLDITQQTRYISSGSINCQCKKTAASCRPI